MCGSHLIRCRRRGGCYQIQITLFAFPLCFFPSRSFPRRKKVFLTFLEFFSLSSSFLPSVEDFFHLTYPLNAPKGWRFGKLLLRYLLKQAIRKVESCKKFDFMHVKSLPNQSISIFLAQGKCQRKTFCIAFPLSTLSKRICKMKYYHCGKS